MVDKERIFLGSIAGALLFISMLMMLPFIGYLAGAAILAFVLKPIQKKLRKYIGDIASTFLVIMLFTVAFIAPFAIGVSAVVEDASQIVNQTQSIDSLKFNETEQTIKDLTGREIDIEGQLRTSIDSFGDIAFGGVTEVLNVLTSLAVGMLIFYFALFYFIKDGERLYSWLLEVTPAPNNQQERLYSEAALMTRSILKGHVLVAIIEGLLGGIALFIAGVPGAAFWTFIMIIMSFIPVIGAFVVWLPAAIYMLVFVDPLRGIFILVYGFTIVSPSDSLLRPYLVDKKAGIHPAAVLIGVLGGVYVFGAIGLFIGPIILGFTKTMVEVVMNEY